MARPTALQRATTVRSDDFAGQLDGFVSLLDGRQQRVFDAVVEQTRASIVEGSPITGAPGQPVDTGELRDSWTVRYERPGVAVIASDAPHALVVELNPRGITYSNHGPHSVALTRAGFPTLAKRVARNIVARESVGA